MRIFCKKLHENFSSYYDYAFALYDCAKQKKWPPRVAPLSGLCVKKSPDCEISPHNIIIHLCHILSRVVVWRLEKCSKVLLAMAVLASILSLSSCVDEDSSSVPESSRRPSSSIASSYSIPNVWTIKRMKSPAKRRKSPEPSTLPQPEKDTFRSTCGGKNSFAIELERRYRPGIYARQEVRERIGEEERSLGISSGDTRADMKNWSISTAKKMRKEGPKASRCL